MEEIISGSILNTIKYKVLRELAKLQWQGIDPFRGFDTIANAVCPKDAPPIRCCIYKDRAVVAERIRIGLGEFHGSKDTVQVVSIACDECSKSGYIITDMCRGCVAHNCKEACPRKAIYIDEKRYAHINKDDCVECGRCASACKYGAITNLVRPCERVCPTGAISMAPTGEAHIDHSKCIVCGKCVHECPFGATNDISQVIELIDVIKEHNKKIYAIVAPAVAAQFPEAATGQVYAGLKKLGFDEIVEVAQGADLTALAEAEELIEKGFITSSCCPAFVEYINVEFPELNRHVSDTPSPMIITAKMIREKDPDAEIVFIGPCIAKKWERKNERGAEIVDKVLTFFELNALFDSKDIDISALEAETVTGASSFGRGFAQSSGVAAAIKQALIELGHGDFDFRPVVCSGIEECKAALRKAKAGKLDGNFIEGMACEGGCVFGNGNLINKKNPGLQMKKYMEESEKKTLK
ncbi:MAG: monomeric [FeFe] hydrogenase [Clostridia bacterium]|nr:monomeric [FeFe] hydrogenase [Clostridia bacterium]